jgi:hypothetical protein
MALLLTQTTRFGTQTYSRTQTPRYPATLGWTNASIPAPPAPFAQYDWPVPKGARPAGFDWIRSTPIQLIGSDTVYGAPGQVPTYPFPPPQLPLRGRDWIWSTPLNLIGRDTVYGAPGQVPTYNTNAPVRRPDGPFGFIGSPPSATPAPFAQYDWPLAKTTPPKARDWIWSTQIQLIGKDTVYGAPGQVPTYNTNAPIRAALGPFGWLNPGIIPSGTPFAQYDWPVPKVTQYSPRPWILSGLQAPVVGPVPFNQYDWPLPQTASLYPVHRNGWLDTMMVVFSPPPTNYDWPLPQRPAYPTALQTWIQAGSTAAGVINQPGAISFSPPQQPRQPARRGWEWPTPINLIGKDTVYGAPGQVPTYDLRPPLRAPISTNLNGWLNFGIVVGPAPFAQYDWPVPQRTKQPIFSIDFDSFQPAINPFFQTDWPNMFGPVYPTSLRTWIQPGFQPPPTPFSQTDWPQVRATVRPRDWIWSTPIILIGQDTVYGAPGQVPTYDLSPPKLRPYAANLNGWLNPGITVTPPPFSQTNWPTPPRGPTPGKDWIWSTPLNLIGKDTIAGAPGQVLTYPFPVPQRPLPRSDWIWPTPLVLIGQDKVYGAPGQVPTYDIQLAPRGKVLPPPGFISFPYPGTIPAPFTQSTQRPLLTLPIYPVFWKGRS